MFNLFLKRIARNDFFCILLICYIIILFTGTLEQKNFGLSYVQEHYFYSYFCLLFNKVPFLGGKLILMLCSLCLIAKILTDKWRLRKTGIFLIHFGILIMLIGAFVSYLASFEGSLVISEGDSKNYFISDKYFELIVHDKRLNKKKNIELKTATSIISYDNFDYSLKNFFLKKNVSSKFCRFLNFFKSKLFVEEVENKKILFTSFEHCNIILIDDTINNSFENDLVYFELSKMKIFLPFNIHLLKLNKIVYSGTDSAKNYLSNIIIEDLNGFSWKYIVQMNKPLRYKGYTFYQRSFFEDSKHATSVLTVVKNTGSLFPYISIFLIFFGFILHVFFYSNRFFRY